MSTRTCRSYCHHKAGTFSQWAEVGGRIFNIEGLRRYYNHWLGYRYAMGFGFTINRLCLDLLRRSKDGRLPPVLLKLPGCASPDFSPEKVHRPRNTC